MLYMAQTEAKIYEKFWCIVVIITSRLIAGAKVSRSKHIENGQQTDKFWTLCLSVDIHDKHQQNEIKVVPQWLLTNLKDKGRVHLENIAFECPICIFSYW